MPVGYTRPEVMLQLARWNLVRDCLSGQETVKGKREVYLPIPNKSDTSPENLSRYNAYLERAVFLNVTRRTLDGLVGQVFSRDPAVDIPDAMDVLLPDVDGAGVGLDQQAKKALSETVAFGRCGLLVDYPPARVDGQGNAIPATQADLDSGFVRPTITLYEPWEVINWRTVTIGARRVFSLIVISESYILADDGFEARSALQYRVLRLVPPTPREGEPFDFSQASYVVEIWRLDSQGDAGGGVPGKVGDAQFLLAETYEPRDADGNVLTEIPFTFVGALNNDPGVDHPPLYDLAVLNIGHYRNSADYEEASFITGQPTPVLGGLTKTWVDEVLKGQVMLGSRAAVLLPAGGTAALMQAAPNGMPKEAMDTKERQMVALGAKLVEQRQVQRTAQEARQEDASTSSLLSSIAANVSDAYTEALKWCAMFMGASFSEPAAPGEGEEPAAEQEICYALNRDFPAAMMNAQDRAQLIAEWQGAAISYSEMRAQLRTAGVATLDDEAAKEEIAANPARPGFAFERESGMPGAGGEAGAAGGGGGGAGGAAA
jgi:hypothetical protein